MAELGHLPKLGEVVDIDGRRLEVSELDGRRVARVRVSAPRPEMGPAETSRLGE